MYCGSQSETVDASMSVQFWPQIIIGTSARDAKITAAARLVQFLLAVMSGKVLISQSTLTVARPCVFEAASRVAPEIGVCLCVQL